MARSIICHNCSTSAAPCDSAPQHQVQMLTLTIVQVFSLCAGARALLTTRLTQTLASPFQAPPQRISIRRRRLYSQRCIGNRFLYQPRARIALASCATKVMHARRAPRPSASPSPSV